ncbi:MAG: EamA family transporter [Anaerolineales bacterium]
MKARVWLALVMVYITWGSTYLAIRFAVATMPPFLMVAARFLVAGAILYIWRRLAGDAPPRRIEWRSAVIVGLLLLTGGNGSVVWAEQRVVSGIAALMVGAAPLWMVLIDALSPIASLRSRFGGKPSPLSLAGVVIGFAGIALLVGPSQMAGAETHIDPVGIAALGLAGFLWATGSLYSREACLPESPLLGTGMEMLVGGLGSLLVGTLLGEWGRLDLSTISSQSLWGLGYLIVFGSLVGFAAYTWLLRSAPTPLVSTYAYVNPLIAIFIGNLLAQEPLNAHILISALIIISAVALINSAPTQKSQVEAKPVQAPSCSGES